MLTIGEPPARGFDDPLGLMSDCHRRIEKFLAVLTTVGERAAGRVLTVEEAEALTTARRYFAGMATKHTADEEQSLAPRLQASLAAAPDVAEGLARLVAQHVEVAAQHAALDALAEAWQAGEVPAPAQWRSLTDTLVATYAEHIAYEDGTLYPFAASVLTAAELGAIGAEMAERRGQLTCRQRKAADSATISQ